MRRSIVLVHLVLGSALAGCGGGGSTDPGDADVPPAVTGMLRPVASAAELEASLKSALRDTSPMTGVPAAPAANDAGFSNTNTVEAGIDEDDFVRYDGQHLFVAAPRLGATNAIRILRTNPVAATAAQVATIPLPANDFVQGMYVANGRLTVVSSETRFMPWGGTWASVVYWAPSDVTLRVFDIADPAQPVAVMSARFEGVFVASRRIDDRVYLVTRHSPGVIVDPALRARLDSLRLADLLSRLTIDGTERPLVEPANCYVENTPDRRSNAVLTTVTAFSLSNPRDLASICYNESADGVYVSQTALYVSQPHHPTSTTSSTRIHKFALGAASPRYAGSVEVTGMLWSNGQRDFRMSEHDGHLRVLTTEMTTDSSDLFDHRLYVLREKAGENALEIVGRLPNDLRPAEIGKPNENLFGVRFADDRAYAVTFLRLDPLYVFDLSNPADPRVAGELEMPGVSDYLHPVAQNLLLGLGRDGTRVKLELFDVSVLEHPQSRGAVFAPGSNTFTDATWDRHAFTYLPGVAADRFSIPANVGGSSVLAENGSMLLQFEVAGKQVPAGASLRGAGNVFPPVADEAHRWAGDSRSFIHDDAVFYVRGGVVWASRWSAPLQVNGPF